MESKYTGAMDTQNLQAFLAVADQDSFSEAASQLHLTQPAVSKRIAALEQQLGSRLFDRLGRRITLTEAGRALLPRARQILLEVDDTRRLISDLSGKVGGTLALATSHHIGLHRLPPILREFSRAYPQVSLTLDFLDSEKAYEQVVQGRYDVAIITLAPESEATANSGMPAIKVDERIQAHSLWPDSLRFVAAPDHALARGDQLSLQSLSPYPAILPDFNTYTTRLIKGMFDSRGVDLAITMATNHLDTIKMMVSIGLGWAVLPDTLIDQQLQVLDIEGLHVTRKLGCIYHRERRQSNAASAFVALLRQEQINIHTR